MSRIIRELWREYATAVLVLMALIAGLVWGVTIGRGLGTPSPQPSPPGRGSLASPPVEGIEGEPSTEHLTLPGSNLTPDLDAPPPDLTPPAEPRLTVRVDVRDAASGRPLRADVWLTTVVGEDSRDRLIERQTSLIEFDLPAADEADMVYIKVQAEGYYLWSIGVRHKVEYDRLLPLEVRLERVEERG